MDPSSSQPPPLPPRPHDSQPPSTSMMTGGGMYGNNMMYNSNQYGYGMGNYNNMYNGGMYGGGMYGGGMYGAYGGTNETTFSRLAEESSRGAFQSIESVVNAVSSVANMLSSTHNAVYSSFRAVIGVVEQLSRLKTQLSSVALSFWLFKYIIRWWRFALVKIGLKPANYASETEAAWTQLNQPYGADVLGPGGAPSVNWPSLLFWIVALGGPYLIYKCINQMVQTVEEKRKWATGAAPHYTAVTQFDFMANNEHELSFMKDENLRIAPKEEQPRVRGWLLASTQDGSKIGLVPINYVKIVGRKSDSPPLTAVDNISRFEAAFK